jgi:pterin-4a-carbinolamine dehydratase
MEAAKTHWKKMHNPNYLGSWDFQPNEIKTLTIRAVKYETVIGPDGKQEQCSVCHFNESVKPLILNVTNSKEIERIAKTPYVEDWSGTKVNFKIQRVKAFGDFTDAVRVTKDAPQIKQELTPDHPAWKQAIESLKTNKVTIDQIRMKYNVSDAHVKLLTA